MNRETTISVIVPVYNVEEYLPRCVDSILAQTYEKLEVILVDDGTKDASDQICDRYAEKDPRVRVIHKENGGLSSARNAGIDIATGEYLAFVDSDDWIEPEMYSHMLELMEKYDTRLVCAGRYDVESETEAKTVGLCPEKEELVSGEELVKRIFLWDHLDSAAWDKLYHRSLFEGIRYPVGKIVEDVPTTYRLALRAGNAVLCDRPFYNYFHRPNSITTQKTVTEKNFHFPQHTAKIYSDIRENYPALEPYARFLRVRSLYHILVSLDQAEPEVRQRFSREHRELRKELRPHLGFVWNCPWLGRQEKITDLLLTLGIYRQLRPIFHRHR